jgi:hypothetical protein
MVQCAWCRRMRSADGTFGTRATAVLPGVQHVMCRTCAERMIEQAWLRSVLRRPSLESPLVEAELPTAAAPLAITRVRLSGRMRRVA